MNNNNRGNNNRRRGRGNNNRPQGGGGQQLNRIDSRARGNAPQMLEKYRKLAQDSHLNGDRVQAEYYLQFADHYFRVIADTRVRQEEQRARPGGERWQEPDQDNGDGDDFGMEGDFPGFNSQTQAQPSRPREDRPRDDRPREDRPREDRPRDDRPRDDRPREDRQREPRRFERARETEQAPEAGQTGPTPVDLVPGVEGEPITEAADNPFVRDARPTRGLRPRTDRRPPRDTAARGEPGAREEPGEAAPTGLDPASLPPSLGSRAVEATAAELPLGDEAPAPRKRGRPRKNPLPEASDVVNG